MIPAPKGIHVFPTHSTSTDHVRSCDDTQASDEDDESIAEHARKVEELRQALKIALKDLEDERERKKVRLKAEEKRRGF